MAQSNGALCWVHISIRRFLAAIHVSLEGMFWRWIYITKGELYTYVVAPNAVWVFIPAFGLYVSVRLILDGNYGVLGF